MEKNGVGELIIQSIDKDGTMEGYDIELIKSIATSISVPVVALGGAGKKEDLIEGYQKGHANGLVRAACLSIKAKSAGC